MNQCAKPVQTGGGSIRPLFPFAASHKATLANVPHHLNVLLVEDNTDDVEILLTQLRDAGYDPREQVVATKADYLAALNPELDVILSDYRLPCFSATEALELLKACGMDIPFVLVSETVGEALATQLVRDGAADYLFKDRPARLGTAVSHAVQQKHQRAREKRALEELRRLATIVESSEDAIISTSTHGRIVNWNQGAERMFGYAMAEAIGSEVLMLVPPVERNQMRSNFDRLRQGHRVQPFETTRLHKDGTEIHVSVLASPIKDQTGEIIGIATAIRDVGALRAAHEALRRKSLLTQMLAATAAAANASESPVEALQSCLSNICAYGDWTIGHVVTFGVEGLGRPVHSLWDTADRARFESFIAQANRMDYADSREQFLGPMLATRQPLWIADIQTLHLVGRTAALIPLGIRCAFGMPVVVDGTVVALIEVFSEQVRPRDDILMGAVPGLAAQLAQVIRRQRAIDALRASQEKLDGILGRLQEVVWSIDPRNGAILYVNAAVEPVTRQPAAYFMAGARRWRRMVHRDDRKKLQGFVRRLMREGTLHDEFRIVRGDGEVRTLEARARRNDKEGTERIDGIVSDITEHVRAAALQQQHYALARLQALLAAAANGAGTVEEALQASLDVICEQGDWQLAHMALFAPDMAVKRSITTASLWSVDDSARYTAFIGLSNDLDYTTSNRIADRIITGKVPVWIENMQAMKPLHRLAVEAGLNCVFAFPVVVQDDVAAIIELYADNARPADRFLIDNIENVSMLLARVIERARTSEVHDRLAAIVESSQDAIVSSAPDGTILTWNPGAERMFGYTETDIIGQNLTVLVPEELREEMQQRRGRYLAGIGYEPIETECLTKDKHRLPVSVNISPIKDGTGKVIGVATIYRNITERVQAEELQRNQHGLTQLHAALGAAVNEAVDVTAAFKASLDLISRHGSWRLGHMAIFASGTPNNYNASSSLWRIDDNDRTHFAAFITMCERYDYTSGKRFVGKAIVEKVPVWIEDLATAGLGHRSSVAIAAGLRCAFAFPVIVQNDVAAVLEFYSDEARPADQLLLGNIMNITAQLGRAIERARAGEVHARLAAIVENSDDAIIGRAFDGTITSWNAGAEKLFGYTAAETVGQRTLRLTPPELRHETVRSREMISRGLHVPAFETVRVTKDGRQLHLQITMSPTKDGSGNVIGMSSICRDIGERVRIEERQRKQYKLAQLQTALTQVANEAVTAEAALQTSLRLIRNHGGWTLGHLTTYAQRQGLRTVVSSFWQTEETEDTARFTALIERSEEFVGADRKQFRHKVLHEKIPIWLEDLATVPKSRRITIALDLGLRRAFAFPVVVQDEAAALLEFYAEDARVADTLLIENIGQIAAQLARVIERSRATEVQSRLAAIVESSQDGIVSSSLDGTILTWNPGAEKIFGYANDEVIGQNLSLVVPDGLQQEIEQQQRVLLADDDLDPFESERLTKDNRRVAMSVNVSNLKDETGTVIGFATTYRDITERKHQDQKIEKLSRMRAVSSAVNAAIVRFQNQGELLQEVCRIAVEYGGFGIAWIGLLDLETLDIIPAACAGAGAESLMATSRNSARADAPLGQSILGSAIRAKRPLFSNDLAAETSPGSARRQEALRRGYCSYISLPLLVADKAVGGLSLFTKEHNFFDDEEIKVLTELAGNVSFALDLLKKGEALKESEKKLDDILGTLQEVVWSMDARSGRILYINTAVERVTGRTDGYFAGQARAWRSMVHRDDRPYIFAGIRRLFRENSQRQEFRIALASGEVRTVQSNARVRRDELGNAVRVDGTVTDITARVRAEELQHRHYVLAQLQAAIAKLANEAVAPEKVLQTSLRLISDYGGWLIGHLTTFKPGSGLLSIITSTWETEDRVRFVPLLKLTDNFTGRSHRQFRYKAACEKVPVWIEDIASLPPGRRTSLALDLGLRCAFAFPVVVQNETAALLEFYAEDVRPIDTLLIGNISQIGAQLARVIERARASEVHTRFTAIVESSQDGIVSSTPDGTILTWNPGAEKMFGYASTEIVGRKLSTLVPEDLREEIRQRRQRYLDSGSFDPYESERLTKDHRRFAVSVNASPLKDVTNKVIGIATIYRDITERKKAEAKLLQLNEELEEKVAARTVALDRARTDAEEANRAKSMFLATMSHEIRTPMNGVVGMIDVLHQTSLRGDQVEMVNLIRESAFSLLGIINDILDFSKIEAGKLDIEREVVALADVVEGVGNLLDSLAEKKQVILALFTDPAIPAAVMGDTLRLRQVLLNLVNNAIKFSSGESRAGRVSIRALLIELGAEQALVEFRIADNGVGMDDDTLARLFTAFTQADASTTRRFGGTGLGLVIANNLVELMGGEITVQSAPGEGATFKVRLMFDLLPNSSGEAVVESPVAGLACIVVGDHGGLADDLAVYLQHAQALVERAPTLEIAKRQSADGNGLSVWIVDAGDRQPPVGQLHAAVRGQVKQDIRFVCVLAERGKRRRPRVVAPDLITIDGNSLGRRTLLRAVAAAAGRASLEIEGRTPVHDAVVSAMPSRDDVLRDGRLILIAEDNETNQKVIIRQLALLGYVADVAGDGLEALDRWRGGEYALLLTDLHMPRMDGYELTQTIRNEEKRGHRIPIIALTANVLKGEADRCRAVGMDAYQSKPMPLADLKTMLDQWMPAARTALMTSALPDSSNAAVAQAPARKPVDVSVLKALVGDSPDIVREFLLDFNGSATKIAQELRAAYAAQHTTDAAAAAHKLKSSAFSVGALALGELCAAIELEVKSGGIDALTALLPRFEAEMAAVKIYLDNV